MRRKRSVQIDPTIEISNAIHKKVGTRVYYNIGISAGTRDIMAEILDPIADAVDSAVLEDIYDYMPGRYHNKAIKAVKELLS